MEAMGWALQLTIPIFAFFSAYFVYFRLFALGFFHLGLDMPRMWLVAALSLFTSLAASFAPYLFFKKNPAADFLKAASKKTGKRQMAAAAALAGLCGPHLPALGLDEIEIGGISGFFLSVSGICAGFVFFALLFWGICGIWEKTKPFWAVFRDWKFVAFVLGANLAVFLYLALSKQVYFWDNAGYWESAAGMSEIVFSDPGRFFKNLVDSVFASDYNLVPAALPAIAMAVFGAGRLVFALSVLNFYFVPFLAFVRAAAKDFAVFSIVALCLPMAFYLTALGFLDVGGAFLSLVALYIFIFRKTDPPADFLCGAALCLLLIFRRWYIFFAAAFVLCAVAYALALRGDKIKKCVFSLLGFFAPSFVFFQGYFTKRLLGENYADIYSAYKFPLETDVKIFLRYFGILPVLALAGYAIYGIASKKQKKEELANTVFLHIFSVAVFFGFTAVQTHGQQHLLLYVPAFALLLIKLAKSSKRAKAILSAVAVCCTAGIFLPGAQPQSLGEIASYAILPSFGAYPVVREDARELARLAEYVKNLDGDVAVLASSFVLNADIIAKTEASLNILEPLKKSKNIAYLPEVDKRDGKPYNIVYVSYIVVALPIQTHLDPNEQLAVAVPASMLASGAAFSSAFEKMDVSFALKDGVEAHIYRRVRPNTEEEMEEVWEAIDMGRQGGG